MGIMLESNYLHTNGWRWDMWQWEQADNGDKWGGDRYRNTRMAGDGDKWLSCATLYSRVLHLFTKHTRHTLWARWSCDLTDDTRWLHGQGRAGLTPESVEARTWDVTKTDHRHATAASCSAETAHNEIRCGPTRATRRTDASAPTQTRPSAHNTILTVTDLEGVEPVSCHVM